MNFSSLVFTIFVLISVTTSSNVTKIPWDQANNPFNFPTVQSIKFDILPLNGTARNRPWTGYHWPSREGGIAQQWQLKRRASITGLKTFNQFERMTRNEKLRLSPAEKLDLILGDYSYYYTNWELRNNPVDSVNWAGVCDGLAMASMNLEQPSSTTVRNRYNQEIPLTTSDIKAFASWYFARVHRGTIYWVGQRCDRNRRSNDPCWDVNPGAFHVILANHIGYQKRMFLMDNTKGKEVWNYPVFEYWSRILNSRTYPNGSIRYRMQTTIKHGRTTQPHMNPIPSEGQYTQRTFSYYLDVNPYGEITGGEWISDQHPDFLWYRPFENFLGNFSFLNNLVRKIHNP